MSKRRHSQVDGPDAPAPPLTVEPEKVTAQAAAPSSAAPSSTAPAPADDQPTLVRNTSRTILASMNSARAAPHGTLSAEEEAELRSFYLELMERRTRDGWHAVEQMMKEIVSAMMAQAQGAAAAAAGAAAAAAPAAAASDEELRFVVRATGPRTGQLQRVVGSRFVFCGRLGDCNALVGHSLADDGAAKEDTRVSRVQFILLRVGHELVVLDSWSMCGTRTVERGAAGAALQSSTPGARQTLLFGTHERFTLDVGGGAGRITFNPVDADMEDDDGWPVPSVDSMSEAAAPAATADAGPAPFPNIRPVS